MRQFRDRTLVLATHNAGKVEEMAALLADRNIEIRSAVEFGLAIPEETENTFVGNARLKAHAASQATGLPALADDSGITIDALDGAPGVFTADWAEGPDGRDFLMAMRKTEELLIASGKPAPFAAQFRCTLVLAWPDGHDEVFEGVANGTLVMPIRGKLGHGYDPMFQPEGESETFAEMDLAKKNRLSHRFKAFDAFLSGCFT